MGKINEDLKLKLIFVKSTSLNSDGYTDVKIHVRYEGIYREYVYTDLYNNIELDQKLHAQDVLFAENVLTHAIERALKEGSQL